MPPFVPYRLSSLAAVVGAAGPAFTARAVRRQLWSTQTYLGLHCDLGKLPPVPSAQIDVVMRERDVRDTSAFADELRRVRGADAYECLVRTWSCEAGVESLYMADSGGEPVYCQWLVRRPQQEAITRHVPGGYSALGPGEVLLEGAYTFSRFRGRRAMAAGMLQLLHRARDEGATTAVTYVAPDNVPSLRGCARAGFDLHHRRVNERRLGRRRSGEHAIDLASVQAWKAATAPS